VKVNKEKSSDQGKQRLGGEGNSLEKEAGEHYGPMVATGKSSPGLGTGDDFNTVSCHTLPCALAATVHVASRLWKPPLGVWTRTFGWGD
jgi:hypothetical protein